VSRAASQDDDIVEVPSVSVVIVNYRGADHTITCLDAVRELDWPPEALEVIVVDNASGDDSVERIRAAHPGVTVIPLKENTGFAAGCNRGVAAASGTYVAFLNNDGRPDGAWLAAAVEALEGAGSVACVASKVLDWEGHAIDFVGGGLSFYGHGFKRHVGEPDGGFEDEADVLFASGAALVIDASVFRDVGGFDEHYFMFFEDVDLGWRLWVRGYRVRYVPRSIVYHHHHASMSGVSPWREHYLLERNALFTIFKNYDEENLRTFLAPALALAVRRGVALGGDDPHILELTRQPPGPEEPHIEVHRQTVAAAFAIDGFVEALPWLAAARSVIQGSRRRPDSEILRLFWTPFQANVEVPAFVEGFRGALEAFDLGTSFSVRRRVLIVTGDTLRPTMAGPAIRAWQIARALSREHEVQLVSTTECRDLSHPDFVVRKVTKQELRGLEQWCHVCVLQGHVMYEHPCLRTSTKVMVIDLYDPFHLEQLEQARDLGEEKRRLTVQSATDVLNEQLARGDVFLCASEKQRDFWLGQLAAVGRINPRTYDADETLRNLIRVVPFGVSDGTPHHTRPAIRGVVAGIGPKDKVILWGGGIYNWFDPLTLIQAVDKLRARLPEVRVFFLGMKHPNPHVPEMRMAATARELSDELGLTGSHVFFNEGWVPYDDRQNYLLEADVGVSTHLDHVETEFSFRTRILDYLWAALPIVATGGDGLAEFVKEHGIGRIVPAGDVDALERALHDLLADPKRNRECRDRMHGVADDLRWSRVLEPLLAFCREPHRAPDLVDPAMVAVMRTGAIQRQAPRPSRWRTDLRTLFVHLRSGDLRSLFRKIRRRLRRTLRPS
jgi:GT2 family glycosyltransferase